MEFLVPCRNMSVCRCGKLWVQPTECSQVCLDSRTDTTAKPELFVTTSFPSRMYHIHILTNDFRTIGIVGPLLSVLSTGILRSAWVEADTTVHAVMWQPLLTFLKGILQAFAMATVLC